MKTWKVKTIKDIDTVVADEVFYSTVHIKFQNKVEQKQGMIFTGDADEHEEVIVYPYQNVISVQEIKDGEV